MKYDDLVELLADIEHIRWSKWQKYVHELSIRNEDGSLTIPAIYVQHWDREIKTEYKDLPNNIQESDRKEARTTLNAISKYLVLDDG